MCKKSSTTGGSFLPYFGDRIKGKLNLQFLFVCFATTLGDDMWWTSYRHSFCEDQSSEAIFSCQWLFVSHENLWLLTDQTRSGGKVPTFGACVLLLMAIIKELKLSLLTRINTSLSYFTKSSVLMWRQVFNPSSVGGCSKVSTIRLEVLLDMGFHFLIFSTFLPSAMRSTWPSQFSLCFLINPIIILNVSSKWISLVWL